MRKPRGNCYPSAPPPGPGCYPSAPAPNRGCYPSAPDTDGDFPGTPATLRDVLLGVLTRSRPAQPPPRPNSRTRPR
jgi:hypothetical protein